MFLRTVLISCSLLCVAIAILSVLIWGSIERGGKDYEVYISLKATPEVGAAKSHRTAVRKEIHHVGAADLSYRLDCDQSALEFRADGEILEKMEGVHGLIQEALFYAGTENRPMQRLQQFEARSALVSYRTAKLDAWEVDLVQQEAPGHKLPPGLIRAGTGFCGQADALAVQMDNEGKLQCQAKRLHATLYGLPRPLRSAQQP
jgi:hypothetical protein